MIVSLVEFALNDNHKAFNFQDQRQNAASIMVTLVELLDLKENLKTFLT
jgi:hypothetical protein